MTLTRHGHHIPGTAANAGLNPARCGGMVRCSKCQEDAEEHRRTGFSIEMPVDYAAKAKALVKLVVDSKYEGAAGQLPVYEIYLVWFCKTLDNWKAMVATTLFDGMYYEVIYNGVKKETYVEPYKKQNQIVFKD